MKISSNLPRLGTDFLEKSSQILGGLSPNQSLRYDQCVSMLKTPFRTRITKIPNNNNWSL